MGQLVGPRQNQRIPHQAFGAFSVIEIGHGGFVLGNCRGHACCRSYFHIVLHKLHLPPSQRTVRRNPPRLQNRSGQPSPGAVGPQSQGHFFPIQPRMLEDGRLGNQIHLGHGGVVHADFVPGRPMRQWRGVFQGKQGRGNRGRSMELQHQNGLLGGHSAHNFLVLLVHPLHAALGLFEGFLCCMGALHPFCGGQGPKLLVGFGVGCLLGGPQESVFFQLNHRLLGARLLLHGAPRCQTVSPDFQFRNRQQVFLAYFDPVSLDLNCAAGAELYGAFVDLLGKARNFYR